MASIFAYGTLLVPEVMEAVTGRSFPAREAEVAGFARRRLRGRIYPAAIERAGSHLAGRLYEAVDPATLARLDRFEGPLYERREVFVTAAGGGGTRAELYVLAPAHRGELLEEPWDLGTFSSRHLGAYLRGCAGFRAGEEARGATGEDPLR
jgi:gamma-glutamylcyclotransferase (GGCT)/AIG2-like uncharacterized protein YtfP